MAKKMLIDATHPEETRVVVVDGQKVEDFDFESVTKRQLAGNIYLAKVTRVEPSLQAAFVEYGGNRHGFLAFSEVHPDYYQIPVADREALLAEEAREEEERRAQEESQDEERPKKSRSRGRRKKTPVQEADADSGDQSAEVSGLEVIDVEAGPEDALSDVLEVSDTVPAMDDTAPEDGKLDDIVGNTPDTVPSEQAAPAGTEETAQAGNAAPESDEPNNAGQTGSGDSDTNEGPKSIAESAGLEDDERVTEEIGDTASARTVTAEASEDAAPEASDPPEPAEAPENAPDSSAAETGQDAAQSNDASDTMPETAQASGDAIDTQDNEAGADEKPARKPRRRKRTRGKSADPETPPAEDQDEEAADSEVESVGAEDTLEEAARARTRLRRKYKIQDVIKVRQILLVQVVKEERGNKGAALTTYLSLAGRYCVLMPNTARGGGISRKITNAGDRKRLREITGEMEVPQGMGLIVRTAGAERTKAEIKRDYEFLIRQWEQIRERTLESIAPTLIYEEGSLIKRSIRDIYNKDVDQILVEGDGGYREAKEYMKMLMPSHAKNVQPYTDPVPLFSRYQIETTLNGMFNPTVQLKSGGYIVIGVTEALVAIDVNSGRATKQGSIEETALQTNLEAAEEVARQLKLRDLAGLIVIDFIDMDENRNNRSVEKRMKDRLKNDRARIQVGRISAFGLMEMSRQRLRPGMLEATTQPCPHCHGTGLIRSDENLSLSILREVEEEAIRGRADEVIVRAPIDVANYLINHKRQHVTQLEQRHGITVAVMAVTNLMSPKFEIERSKTSSRKPVKEAEVISASSVGIEEAPQAEQDEEDRDGENRTRRRRGKRGGRRRKNGDQIEGLGDQQVEEQTDTEDQPEDEEGGRSRSRRSRGRRRRGKKDENEAPVEAASDEAATGGEDGSTSSDPADTPPAGEPASEGILDSPAMDATEDTTPEPPEQDTLEPVTEVTSAPEADVPEPEEVAEPVLEPAVEDLEPQDSDKPKRRGWWSFGR